jgi:hypothetical protein
MQRSKIMDIDMSIDDIEGYLSLDDFVPAEISDEVAYHFVRSVIHLADVLKARYYDQIIAYAQGYVPPEEPNF